MAILGTFTQQPNEVLDYDIDFSQWLPAADYVDSVVLLCEPAMPTPPSYAIAPNSEPVPALGSKTRLPGAISASLTMRTASGAGVGNS